MVGALWERQCPDQAVRAGEGQVVLLDLAIQVVRKMLRTIHVFEPAPKFTQGRERINPDFLRIRSGLRVIVWVIVLPGSSLAVFF